MERADQEAGKELSWLGRKTFNCEADARKSAESFAKGLKHHRLTNLKIVILTNYSKPGRPAKGAKPQLSYRIEATLERDERAIGAPRRGAGRFILVTNVLDHEEISADELLEEYKDQHSVSIERWPTEKRARSNCQSVWRRDVESNEVAARFVKA